MINKSVIENKEEIILPQIISDNMILQRDKKNKLWGKTLTETQVAVEICGNTYFTFAKNCKFEFEISPHEACDIPFDIIFYTNNAKRTVKNALYGDVFLMSGQSNMQYYVFMTLEGDQGLHTLESTKYIPSRENDPETFASYEKDSEERNKEIIDSLKNKIKENKKIRLGNVDIISASDNIYIESVVEKDDLKMSWSEATEQSINKFSTLAYYFALKMQEELKVPIGVLCNAVGGTFLATWVSAHCFNNNKNEFKYGNTDSDDNHLNLYSRCFNMYLAPIKNFTFKGVVWYQGEGQHDNYDTTLKLLLKVWRTAFSDAELPFLIVELPRYGGGDVVPKGYETMPITVGTEDYSYYRVRKAQKEVVNVTANTALSVNVDLGDYDEIHPSDKFPVAVRAAYKFLECFYGMEKFKANPEILKVCRINKTSVCLEFENIGGGILIKNKGRNIQISSNGIDFIDANVNYGENNSIIITADTNIKYVRYGYLNYPRISRINVSKYLSLFTQNGYPIDQFEIKVND